MSAIERLLDRARCSGITHFTRDELAILHEHLETLTPRDRVRTVYLHGDYLAEPDIDTVWERLGREPTADEYQALAELLRESAAKCEHDAASIADDG